MTASPPFRRQRSLDRGCRRLVVGAHATLLRKVGLYMLALMVLLSGCAGDPQPTAEMSLHSIDAGGLSQAIADHRGHCVLVDFWATWCGPCIELFPHAIKLQQRFSNRGLSVITISLDDPDNRAAVSQFLVDRGATTENFLSTYGVGPAAFTEFGIDDGSLPHVRLYDRQGKLQKTFASGGKNIDPEAIERAVEEMIR
jgi:thiol-disulfide isomerase/thioredoxin